MGKYLNLLRKVQEILFWGNKELLPVFAFKLFFPCSSTMCAFTPFVEKFPKYLVYFSNYVPCLRVSRHKKLKFEFLGKVLEELKFITTEGFKLEEIRYYSIIEIANRLFRYSCKEKYSNYLLYCTTEIS